MATISQEKQTQKLTLSPLREQQEDDYEDAATNSGCGNCFGRFLSFNNYRRVNNNNNNNKDQKGVEKESWVSEKLKKLKEFSELIAGPKWKTFIRKLGGYCNNRKSKRSKTQFQYDAQSYALNFDDDNGADGDDDYRLFHSFSARFAAPVSSDG
ncbi:hypothetical protein RJ641_025502 [Dillenia turbinata]|uniref:Uncharacterized protein n=1 Tax=Dillenia turbinata TaxID=194707 RepID=A0AAN8ZT41_9MAGN